MSMYFVGIDISKYKHDCCILSAADQNVVSKNLLHIFICPQLPSLPLKLQAAFELPLYASPEYRPR